MAYKSRVTNKYYGSTYGGRPNVARSNELSQIVNTLSNMTPALEQYSQNYITDKKKIATDKLQELYASGLNADEISKQVLSGQHKELTNMYAESAIHAQNGRFKAADVIAKITADLDNYDHTTQTLDEFYKKHIPDFNGKDQAYVTGFATVFNQYKAEEAIKDGVIRAKYAHNKKMEAGVTLLQTVTDIDNDYWAMVKSLNTELPAVDGKKQYFFSNDEMNEVAIRHAEVIFQTAKTPEDIQVAIDILTADRGKGAGGNELGSLLSTNKKEVTELISKLNDKSARLENQNRIDEEDEKQEQISELFKDAFSEENRGNFDKQNEVRDALLTIDPASVLQFDRLIKADRNIDVNPDTIDDFLVMTISGAFDTPTDLVKYMNDNGIPMEHLTGALGLWGTAKTDAKNNALPIHQSNSTYVEQISLINSAIKGAYTDTSGIFAAKGGNNALRKAANYMTIEINAYEQRYFDEHGKKPSNEERREFMQKLGDYVMSTYGDANKNPMGTNDDAKPMTWVEGEELRIENEKKEKQKILEEEEQAKIKSIDEGVENMLYNLQLAQTLAFPVEELKEAFTFDKDDKQWFSFEGAEITDWQNKVILPEIEKFIEQNILSNDVPKQYLGEILDKISNEDADLMVNYLVNQVNNIISSDDSWNIKDMGNDWKVAKLEDLYITPNQIDELIKRLIIKYRPKVEG